MEKLIYSNMKSLNYTHLVIFFISLSVTTLNAQLHKSIITPNAGKLSSLINMSEVSNIRSLQITGPLDARDFAYIRQMQKLEKLDLSNSTIKAYKGKGGTAYNDTDTTLYAANEIPQTAFFDLNSGSKCDSIKLIILPKSCTSIGMAAFESCDKLIEIKNIEQLLSISEMAFNNCSLLREFTLGAHLSYLGSQAFCRSGLQLIRFKCQELDGLDTSTFYFCSNLKQINIGTPLPTKFNITDGLFLALHADIEKIVVNIPRGTKNLFEKDLNWNIFKKFVEY